MHMIGVSIPESHASHLAPEILLLGNFYFFCWDFTHPDWLTW